MRVERDGRFAFKGGASSSRGRRLVKQRLWHIRPERCLELCEGERLNHRLLSSPSKKRLGSRRRPHSEASEQFFDGGQRRYFPGQLLNLAQQVLGMHRLEDKVKVVSIGTSGLEQVRCSSLA